MDFDEVKMQIMLRSTEREYFCAWAQTENEKDGRVETSKVTLFLSFEQNQNITVG